MTQPSQRNENEQGIGRRSFLKYLIGFSGLVTVVGVLTPVIGYLWPPERASTVGANRVPVGPVTDFPIGQGTVVSVEGKPVILVNTEQGGLKAYSAICTHLGCITEWDANRQFILCPCHDARFNALNGTVISGPAPAALPELVVTVEQDTVYVSQA